MTRRNEDSGLIDLDALMREAGGSAETPHAAPTPAPTAVRPAPTSVPEPAPSGPPTVRPPARVARDKAASAPSYAEGDVVDIAPVRSAPASRPSADAPAPASAAKPARASTPPASSASAGERAQAGAGEKTASVPPAPSTTPSKLWPDSLEAVTTEPLPRVAEEGEPAGVAATAPVKASAPPRGRRGALLAAALALVALAGAFAVVRARGASDGVATASPPGPTARADDAPPSGAAAAPAGEAPGDLGASMDDLPTAVTAAASASASVARPTSARVNGAVAKAQADDEPAPAATLTEAALAPSGASAAGDLGDAMRGAVGAREQAKSDGTETTSGPNASQVRPSPGAVVGALGSVLPAARACLGPDDPVRSGLVVFKSDGTVARVELRGSKPEDECVRSALAKAKVAPFVDDTFSTRVTVRP